MPISVHLCLQHRWTDRLWQDPQYIVFEQQSRNNTSTKHTVQISQLDKGIAYKATATCNTASTFICHCLTVSVTDI